MGKVIGIFGDPNTGKSVLAYHIFNEMKKRNLSVFRQEGDPSAPTPPWYLETPCRETADALRRQAKTGWCNKSAEWVASSLEGLKKSFDYVIVDLGGGRPPEIRITPELEKILDKVDEGIILCQRGNTECKNSWRKEIAEKKPHIRIKAFCESDISAESKVNEECVFGSLDRIVAHAPPEHLIRAVNRAIDKFII